MTTTNSSASPSSATIISFPGNNRAKKTHRREPSPDLEEIRLQKCINHISDAIVEMSEIMTSVLAECGFDIKGESDLYPDLAFAIEAIKSVMFKYYGLEFYPQKIASHIYVETGPGEYHRTSEPILSKSGKLTFVKLQKPSKEKN